MPILVEQYINAESPDGKKYHYKAKCRVSSDGVFALEVEPTLEDIAHKMREDYHTWPNMELDRERGHYWVKGKVLDRLVAFVKAAALTSISGQEITERVICYAINTDVCFWFNRDQSIAGNGGCHNADTKGGWWTPQSKEGDRSQSNPDGLFTIGLAAVVMDKITTTRPGCEATVRYERVRAEGNRHDDGKTPERRLNSFATSLDPESSNMREMPYSDASATFFADTLEAICHMAKRMDSFFGNKAALQKAIEARTTILLTNENPK